MADRPDFAQDRQLRRRFQQSVHCGAARYRHTDHRNQSYRFLSTNDSIRRVSNFCSEILSKTISHCNAFLVSITLLNVLPFSDLIAIFIRNRMSSIYYHSSHYIRYNSRQDKQTKKQSDKQKINTLKSAVAEKNMCD